MGRWTDYEIQRDFTDWVDLCDAHNADCAAYEATIAELRDGILPSQVHAHSHYQHVKRQRDTANATLDALREAVQVWMSDEPGRLIDRMDEMIAILYSKETTNDDR